MNGITAAFLARLTFDAEYRYTATGMPVVQANVIVIDHKAADGADPEFVRVSHFIDADRNPVDPEELAAQLTKGTECYCEGRLRLGRWTAADGSERSGLNLSAWKLEPLGKIGRRRPPRAAAERVA